MVIVDTSAWIEFFGNGIPEIVQTVDDCLVRDLVGIGDLVYCEVVKGLRIKSERDKVMTLLQSLPRFDMVGFDVAEKAAGNYRRLRQKGVTVRKTIDVIIGTFCAENNFEIVHNDRDFTLMAKHLDLKIYRS